MIGFRSILLFLLLTFQFTPLAAQERMTLLHNATIHTIDADDRVVDAMVFANGEILAVGAFDDLRSRHPDAALLDAEGHVVIPGLIDAHGHVMGLGASLLQANLVGAHSIDEVVSRLQEFEAGLPPDAWLIGRGWDQNEWPVAEFPTASDLDEAFPDRPVYLGRVDGHAAWVNSAALELVGGLDDVEDPPGGRILRDESGRATGVLIDAAMGLVGDLIPPPDDEMTDLALRRALEETARHGLTGVHDAGIDLATIRLFERAIEEDQFPLRVYGMIGGPGETLDAICERGPILDVGGMLTVRSIKLYIDGALGSRGAALLEDYADEAGNRGLLLLEPDEYLEIVGRAMDCGLQVNTHAIGDRGARLVLDTYQELIESDRGGVGRHRVEHAQVVAPEDFERFGDLGVIASVQPIHATSDMGWAGIRLGEERTSGAYAWRSLLEGGARLALGSDFPVEPVNPMLGFHAAVTRTDTTGHSPGGWHPEQALTRAEALRGFTIDAAHAAFQEDHVGSLETGKRADFVILDRDIVRVPEDDLLGTRVLATYIDGEPVFHADE